MNKNYKKIIVFLLSLVVLFLILNFFILKNESGSEIDKISDIIVTKEEALKNYANEAYNFSIQYPSSLIYKEENFKKQAKSDMSAVQPDFTVSFNDKESDFSLIRVSVFEDAKFASLEDWLKADNQLLIKNNNASSRIERALEKTIKIDGSDAFVTFIYSTDESDEISKHERKTVFIKDGSLFVISTRFTEDSDHEAIWESFNFTD
jgi:hypothetical protein